MSCVGWFNCRCRLSFFVVVRLLIVLCQLSYLGSVVAEIVIVGAQLCLLNKTKIQVENTRLQASLWMSLVEVRINKSRSQGQQNGGQE